MPPKAKIFGAAFFKKLLPYLFLLCITACAAPPQPVVPRGGIALAVAERGWHTEIGVPEAALTGPLAQLGPARLHRHYLLIGFGARAYFTNPQAGAGTAAVALFPGPSAINLSAFDDLSADPARRIVWIYVSQADVNNMLAFVWAAMPHTGAAPVPIVTTSNASMFYAARPGYNMLYNCNNWAVDALRAGGLPFSNSGLHYAADVQAEAQRIAAGQVPP